MKNKLSKLRKYFCEGGELILKQCSAGKGKAGAESLQEIADVVGVPVSAPTVDVRFGFLPEGWQTKFPKK